MTVRARLRQREWLQDYRNRDYVQHFLSDSVFDLCVGEDYMLSCMTTGCLDALDNIPAGSVMVTAEPYYDQRIVVRGQSQEEADRIYKLMTEMLEEL